MPSSMIANVVKMGIRVLEYSLMLTLLVYYVSSAYNDIRHASLVKILSLYPLVMSFYYYLVLVTTKITVSVGSINSICTACKEFRPRMASHCDFCDICVPNRDHHCPLAGKCICAENAPVFLFFLLFLAIEMFLSIFISPVPEIFVFLSLSTVPPFSWTFYLLLQTGLL